ncbi:hypothetical protein C5O88_23585 [Escherichia coli]|nr:hypothetical protein C5O88_23585 [Escherichia coli]PPW91783.1 hypothetical protein C5P04_23475 [Escherichia coli]HAH3151359.1 hypothetical protein [Escherichia coli]
MAFLRLLKAEYVPVVRNQDNTGDVKRYSDNKEFEIKREWCPEVWAVMGRFSGITDLYLLRFSRIYRRAVRYCLAQQTQRRRGVLPR